MTRSVRLTFARAISSRAGCPMPAATPVIRSAAFVVVFFLVRFIRRSRCRRGLVQGAAFRLVLVGRALLDLGFDLRQFVGFRLQILGVLPLEAGFQLATDAPIGVAEMVV